MCSLKLKILFPNYAPTGGALISDFGIACGFLTRHAMCLLLKIKEIFMTLSFGFCFRVSLHNKSTWTGVPHLRSDSLKGIVVRQKFVVQV